MRALAIFVVGTSLLGCLDKSEPARPPEPTPRELPVRPTPEALATPKAQVKDAVAIDLTLGSELEMRRPIVDGRLTLIPIIATRATTTEKFITLHDGMARGVVKVRELGGADDWEVDTVRVTNRARETLVILEGELIEDAMQDRVTAEATTIAFGETANISVRCVEEDRDHGGTRFNPGNAIAELGLRRTVVHGSQDDVWTRVKQINARDRIQTSTNTYRLAAHAQTKGDAVVRRDRLLAQLAKLEERPNMVGLAVAIDNQVVAIDRLATPELYRQLEGKLIASYLPATAGAPAEGKRVTPTDVRALADAVPGTQTTGSTTQLRPLSPP